MSARFLSQIVRCTSDYIHSTWSWGYCSPQALLCTYQHWSSPATFLHTHFGFVSSFCSSSPSAWSLIPQKYLSAFNPLHVCIKSVYASQWQKCKKNHFQVCKAQLETFCIFCLSTPTWPLDRNMLFLINLLDREKAVCSHTQTSLVLMLWGKKT